MSPVPSISGGSVCSLMAEGASNAVQSEQAKINEMKKLLLLLILILVYTIVCSVGMILIVWLAMKKAMTFSQLTKCGTVGFFSGGIIGADVWV